MEESSKVKGNRYTSLHSGGQEAMREKRGIRSKEKGGIGLLIRRLLRIWEGVKSGALI